MCQGLAALRALGADIGSTYWVGLLAEKYGKNGQAAEGLAVLAEAFSLVEKNGERWWEAELYRLKGMLTLQSQASLGQVSDKSQPSPKSKVQGPKSSNPKPQLLNPKSQGEAETCFHKALELARKQHAKSLELRAAVSLARLWQRQGKKKEGRRLVSEVYGWFAEGFETKDLQEAKALLEELSL